jgi:hypothetical protein
VIQERAEQAGSIGVRTTSSILVAGAAVLIASGVGASQALAVAVSAQALGVLAGASIFLFAAVSHAGLRLAPTGAAASTRAAP